MTSRMLIWFFFFQAEDGIRDRNVTGVQTCALPIYGEQARLGVEGRLHDGAAHLVAAPEPVARHHVGGFEAGLSAALKGQEQNVRAGHRRSEERRVGKEGRSRGSPNQ